MAARASLDQAIQLIAESGHNFHSKVARWFRENGWRVDISPYYMDQSQNKAREIDLVVEKVFRGRTGRDEWSPVGEIAVRLFVECKFNKETSVFWFASKDMPAALDLLCAHGPFKSNSAEAARHHYLADCPRVAKLFATNREIKNSENEPYYKALNQVLNAMVSMRAMPLKHTAEPSKPRVKVIQAPVVVCNSFSQIYSVDFDADSEPAQIADNFQFELQYAYLTSTGQRREHLLVDFVEFSQLPKFNAALAQDAEAALCCIDRR